MSISIRDLRFRRIISCKLYYQALAKYYAMIPYQAIFTEKDEKRFQRVLEDMHVLAKDTEKINKRLRLYDLTTAINIYFDINSISKYRWFRSLNKS